MMAGMLILQSLKSISMLKNLQCSFFTDLLMNSDFMNCMQQNLEYCVACVCMMVKF